jgi:hypothetical protein
MKKKKIAFAMTAALLLSACTEPIDLKTNDSPPVIVIYGTLTDEFEHQIIKITRSSPYFADEPNAGLSEAEVFVRSSEGEVFHFFERNNSNGTYLSKNRFSVRDGASYDLSVTVDFDRDGVPDQYQASTTVLPAVDPDSLSLDPIEMFGHKNHLLYAYFQDPPEENHYLFHITYNDSLLTNRISEYITSDDVLFNGQFVPADLYVFDDATEWEKDSEERREKSVYLYPGDVICTKISVISKEYYDFIVQCQRERGGENPMFGGPASNIVTNISNGGAGYFTGYCVKRKHIMY